MPMSVRSPLWCGALAVSVYVPQGPRFSELQSELSLSVLSSAPTPMFFMACHPSRVFLRDRVPRLTQSEVYRFRGGVCQALPDPIGGGLNTVVRSRT